MAKVSTIIPVYNGSKIIRRAIDSVLNQTYQVAELIIVDDGSTDNTGEIISEYVRIYGERIKYFKKMNEGPGKALEYGIRWAQGDYIALLDQDDYWFEKKLEKQMIQFETNPDIVLVSTDWCEGISSSGEEESVLQRSKYFDRNQFEQLLLENPIRKKYIIRSLGQTFMGKDSPSLSYQDSERSIDVEKL
jgi:glycosyltransferase involved in cell wall biosynthesis